MRGLKPGLLIFLLSTVLILPWLGRQDFYTRGEAREALVIQDLFSSGNWILPRGYSDAVPSKPPLMHWLGALFSLLQGEVNEYTARLPSALAGILFLLFFFTFLSSRAGTKQSLAACVILLTSIEWFRSSIICRVDMLFSALLAAGLLTLYDWSRKDCSGWPRAAVVLLTLATLAKGPVAVLLPALIFALFLLSEKHAAGRVALSLIKFCAPALLLAFIWYVLAYLEQWEAFSHKVYYENIARFLGSQEDKPHQHSAFYLLGTVVLGFFPWSVVVVGVLLAKFRDKRLLSWQVFKGWLRGQNALSRYALIAVLCFVVFFSIPAGKRSVYLLPVYPFLSLYLAELLLLEFSKQAFRRWLGILAALVVGLYGVSLLNLAGIIKLEMLLAGLKNSGDLSFFASILTSGVRSARVWELLLLVLPFLIAAAALLAVFKADSARNSWLLSTALFSSLLLAGNGVLLPWLARALSPRRFAAEVASLLPKDGKLYSFGDEFYGISFYLKRRIYRLEEYRVKDGLVFLNLAKFSAFKNSSALSRPVEILMVAPNPITKPRALVALVRFKS